MDRSTRLSRRFYARDTLVVTRALLGQRLVRIEPDGRRLAGLIVETEAYVGREDQACHARHGRTPRNDSMWGPPGHAYVYFTYGMHWMLNLVTEAEGRPAAVLIRAILPMEGIERMMARRSGRPLTQLADGPAKLCQALSIDRTFDGHDLDAAEADLFVERGARLTNRNVTTGPRVGLNNVPEPWKSLPWRFQVDNGAIRRWQEEHIS